MATGSDMFYEQVCSPCDRDGLNHEATHYCKDCDEKFCKNCINFHNRVIRNHKVFGTHEMDKWFTQLPNFPRDYAFSEKRRTIVNIRAPQDNVSCMVHGICVVSDGRVMIADPENKKLKLFSKDYVFLKTVRLAGPFIPVSVCHVKMNVIAVLGSDLENKRKVDIATVTNQNELEINDTFFVNHVVRSIYHHNDRLYVSSDTGVYAYSLGGKLINILFQELSPLGCNSVTAKCDVRGELVIHGCYYKQPTIETIDEHGRNRALWTEKHLTSLSGVAQHPNGSIFVCGSNQETGVLKVVQISSDGKKKARDCFQQFA